jgi:hypothetical protein
VLCARSRQWRSGTSGSAQHQRIPGGAQRPMHAAAVALAGAVAAAVEHQSIVSLPVCHDRALRVAAYCCRVPQIAARVSQDLGGPVSPACSTCVWCWRPCTAFTRTSKQSRNCHLQNSCGDASFVVRHPCVCTLQDCPYSLRHMGPDYKAASVYSLLMPHHGPCCLG